MPQDNSLVDHPMKRIIELKLKKDYTGNYDTLLLILFAVTLVLIAFNFEDYIMLFPINILVKPFIDLSNTMGLPVMTGKAVKLMTAAFHYLVLISAIASCILLSRLSKAKKKANDNYDALRKDIIKLLDVNFCSCSSSGCSCRDAYIDYMDKHEHIDLIF